MLLGPPSLDLPPPGAWHTSGVTPQTTPHTYHYHCACLIASRPCWLLANGRDAGNGIGYVALVPGSFGVWFGLVWF